MSLSWVREITTEKSEMEKEKQKKGFKKPFVRNARSPKCVLFFFVLLLKPYMNMKGGQPSFFVQGVSNTFGLNLSRTE